MGYGLLADAIVAIHVAYVAYVLFGQLAILAGLALRRAWVYNFWFRVTHLVAIAIVAAEAVLGIPCPLTVWEQDLRGLAGQATTGETFVGRLLHNMLFYDWPSWVFTTVYIAFASVVLATFVLAPPRRPRVVVGS